MSWFNDLANAYDKASVLAGKKGDDGYAPLLPLNHMLSSDVNITITIDENGQFSRAEKHGTKDKIKIIMPATKLSSGRVGNIAPHPLHDQIGYMLENPEKPQKLEGYLDLLSKWSSKNKKVKAVETYVANNTILDDLKNSEIEIKSEKDFIRFRVEILNDMYLDIDTDPDVIKAWQDYCLEIQQGNKELCYATGKYDILQVNHPKGVNSSSGNAKLISSNDTSNYVFRGRFKNSIEANAIGELASHKAHSMLKYLITTQSYRVDSQAVIAFSVDDGEKAANPFASSDELYENESKTEQDEIQEAKITIGSNYAQDMKRALAGYKNDIKKKNTQIAILAVDAATTGRLGITFYQKMNQNQYIDRLITWHETTSFWKSYKGKEKEYKEYAFVQAPSVDKIIEAVYGKPKGEGYNKIKKQAREYLLNHIVNGVPLDRGWVVAAVNRVNNPFSYDKKDGGWDRYAWQDALKVTCAIVRKYYHDKGEIYDLKLDEKNTDRSYLFGRLLAIADKIESHARYLQEKQSTIDKRPTNAVRYKTAFASKPMRTWLLIDKQLNPYIQRLNGAEWYQKQIDDIMELLSEEYDDRPLNGKYLLGYSLQRMMLSTKKDEEENQEENQEL